MRYPFDDETPLTEEEKYLMSQEIEDINEISPFDTYDIDKEEEYFNELIKTEPQMEVQDDNKKKKKK